MTTNTDKLREALEAAKLKLQLYRSAHSGVYVGGMEFTALMRLIDEALAASKPEQQYLTIPCLGQPLEGKPEPQAQAAEPRPTAWVSMRFGIPYQATTDEPTAIRWRKAGGDVADHISMQAHREAMAKQIADTHTVISEVRRLFAEAIAKKDAALDACVESEKGEHCPACPDQGWYVVADNRGEAQQEQCEFCYTNPRSIFNLRRAAITQAQEARK